MIPDNVRVEWIEGGFHGLLPKYFEENQGLERKPKINSTILQKLTGEDQAGPLTTIFPWLRDRPGTWHIPHGFNSLNQEDRSRYVIFFNNTHILQTLIISTNIGTEGPM